MSTVNMKGSRLPKTIWPTLYKVRSAPDLIKLTFDGTTSILCDCAEETDIITVNCNNLDIKAVSVAQVDNAGLSVSKREVDKARQVLLITLSKPLLVGKKVSVHIEYTGTLNDRMQGFYRYSHLGPSGMVRHIPSIRASIVITLA